MRINSQAIIGLELAKTRIDNVNTFDNVNLEDFSILDILKTIEVETNSNGKGIIKNFRENNKNRCSLVNSMPQFEIELNAEKQQLIVMLEAGFLQIGNKLCQHGDTFIHNLATNKTEVGAGNRTVTVHYRKTRVPVTAYISKVSDHIISELNIQPAYFPRFAIKPRSSDITPSWYYEAKNGVMVSDLAVPFIFLELDVKGAITQYGTETPISVMLSTKVACEIAESFNLNAKQRGTLVGLMREDIRGLTVTFKPDEVVDGKLVISLMMPYDNIESDVIDLRPFEFANWSSSFTRTFSEVFEASVTEEHDLAMRRRVHNRLGMYYTYQLAVVNQLCEFKSSFME